MTTPKEFQSTDEIIIPFKGGSSLKVYTLRSSRKVQGWARSDSDGYIYDFELCLPVPDNLMSELRQSPFVVRKMTEFSPDGKNSKVYANNYFSSVSLAGKLKKRQICYIGTVRIVYRRTTCLVIRS